MLLLEAFVLRGKTSGKRVKRVSKIKQNHFYHLLLPRKENLTLSVVFFIAFVCVVCGGGAKENKAKIQEEKVGQKEWKRTVCKAKDGQLTLVVSIVNYGGYSAGRLNLAPDQNFD